MLVVWLLLRYYYELWLNAYRVSSDINQGRIEDKKESKRYFLDEERYYPLDDLTTTLSSPLSPASRRPTPDARRMERKGKGGRGRRRGCRIFGETHKHSTISSEIALFHWHENQPLPHLKTTRHGGGFKSGTNRVIFFNSFHSRGFTRLISDCFPQLRFI